MQQWGNATVDEDTTIFNLNTFRLEANPDGPTHWMLDADLTLNVGAIDLSVFGADTTDADFVINHGLDNANTLNINLLGQDSWTHSGQMIVNAPNAAGYGTLDGDDIQMRGRYYFESGQAQFYSRAELNSQDGFVEILDGAEWHLLGGTADNPNRIDESIVFGDGLLGAGAASGGLVGNGTIETPIRFFGPAQLRADDGTLRVTGQLLDVGFIGTSDTDGVLEVIGEWDTEVAEQVELRGGVLQGSAITNSGENGMIGFGRVTAQIDNRSFIAARQGGTLVIENDNTDWDGTNGEGQLFALRGNLHLVGTGEFGGFGGDVGIEAPYELFVEGFDLGLSDGSTVQMIGGTLRSDVQQSFDSRLAVFQLPAEMRTDALFRNDSENELNARMTLFGETRIEAGASFSGPADLTNAVQGVLTFADQAVIDVDLRGFGKIIIEDGVGHAFANGSASSALLLELEIAGNTLPEYDRFIIGESIALRGVVDVDLLAYDPTAGDEFDLLDFKTFIDNGYELNLPGLNPGLFWDASDFETEGILRIAAVPEPATGLLFLYALLALDSCVVEKTRNRPR